jgi:hypothetical protein
VNALDQIDPFAAYLTKEESVALHMMKDKHQRYIAKGWTNEARGMRSAILILWQALRKEVVIDTGWGEM